MLCTDVPSAPGHLKVTSATHELVTLQWTAPPTSGVELLHYYISVVPPSGSCPQSGCNVTGNSTVITGLRYGTNYTVTVAAVNCAGEGELSLPLRVMLVAECTINSLSHPIFNCYLKWCSFHTNFPPCNYINLLIPNILIITRVTSVIINFGVAVNCYHVYYITALLYAFSPLMHRAKSSKRAQGMYVRRRWHHHHKSDLEGLHW